MNSQANVKGKVLGYSTSRIVSVRDYNVIAETVEEAMYLVRLSMAADFGAIAFIEAITHVTMSDKIVKSGESTYRMHVELEYQ